MYVWPGLILDLRAAKERRLYKVTPSLIGWTPTSNQPWWLLFVMLCPCADVWVILQGYWVAGVSKLMTVWFSSQLPQVFQCLLLAKCYPASDLPKQLKGIFPTTTKFRYLSKEKNGKKTLLFVVFPSISNSRILTVEFCPWISYSLTPDLNWGDYLNACLLLL